MVRSYVDQQNHELVAKLAAAQLEVRRLDAELQAIARRLSDTTRHRDELLVEVREMTVLVDRLNLVVGNVMLAHAEIVRVVDLAAIDPRLAEAVRDLTAALRGHFIDD